ncbi:Phosphoenolpyruvate carboxylase [Methyloligella halotolerans]|uniref:Phosphoenolpyruvate carboxylase n=1 Tax=Methyloligella halotolerans TaxID=1177755 RepID=A0A1E2RWG7_9HYPH|nr:phosphoenolpyruvate carboxylase [Methyloligella halotolerans]ODA66561.1 Phosphoenolpyruvate carboxylase [Methyloligella halotolerans]
MTSVAAVASEGENQNSLIDRWTDRMREYRDRVPFEPQSNPVRQLALDLSRALEAGEISREDLEAIAKALSDQALVRRAKNSVRYLGDRDADQLAEIVREQVRDSAFKKGERISFAKFRARWEKPREGIVFTAHPTFAIPYGLREILVQMIDTETYDDPSLLEEMKKYHHTPEDDISLGMEHEQAQKVIENAQEANGRIVDIVLSVARELYPEEWHKMKPRPIQLSSWVGYDLDGRTDIQWYDCLRIRLDEKRIQIARDIEWIKAVGAELDEDSDACKELMKLVRVFDKELKAVTRQVELFNRDLEDPEQLTKAANELTKRSARSRKSIIARADRWIGRAIDKETDDDVKQRLVRLRAQIVGCGLGTARIHLRLNAQQLHNAIRKPMGLEGNVDVTSHVLLGRLDRMVQEAKEEQVNFGTLFVERATAVRQFIVAAQILKHVDPEAPIRLLIAETESPFTVLAALYFAKQFGIADKLDISPLFETVDAFEHGARVIESLLETKSYREKIKTRGRLCVQHGFSDSGRFMGQIPAGIAIERLQAQLTEVVANAGLGKIDFLIFDTHGESMGRGGHPRSLTDRFLYTLSPWAQQRIEANGLGLHHETSFQGGDGFVLFGTPNLAFRVLAHAMIAPSEAEPVENDKFYSDSDFIRDFYEGVRQYQIRVYEDENYRHSLAAFGTNFLVKPGSRKTKRQYDAAKGARNPASEVRAIPHNALLQQFGMALNVVNGVATAMRHEPDRFVHIYRESPRMQQLLAMVAHAKNLSSIKTLVAYSSVFDDAFWVTRPYGHQELHVKEACLYLADLLRDDRRHDAMMHLASFLRKDAIYLDDTFSDVGLETRPEWEDGRLHLDVLQAVRLALIQHIFLLAARVPRFSTRNDIARDQIIGLILSLRVEEAVQLLREAFPKDVPEVAEYSLAEPATYTGYEGSDYAEINRTLIDPIVDTYRMVLEIGVGVSHHFGAYG